MHHTYMHTKEQNQITLKWVKYATIYRQFDENMATIEITTTTSIEKEKIPTVK